ncbi:MAG TPA: ATP-binding cassette domain-containing protein [Egibacteraceae bacterium]|nr:ATP-binding cassette domain-containing protein [Egibacteraceae bacterium]
MDVRIRALTVDFPSRGVRALDGVDLAVAEGERVALLGPSGAGKTTLLRAILAAVRPATGSIRVGGADPFSSAQVRHIRRSTGMLRQGTDLVNGVSARTNALMGTVPGWGARGWLAVLRGRTPAAYAGRLQTLAERHGLSDCLAARVEQLSGGQRQRVALVRALLPAPRLLLADEPTSGLDVRTAATAVASLLAADAATVLVATHDLDVARDFPRVVALRAGRVVYDGPGLDEATVERIYGRGHVLA